MLQLIPRYPRRIDTSTLHDKLQRRGYDITLRSIQRDLNKLSGVLPALCSDSSKPQGWWWAADADLLEIPGLDPQAALVFKMAEQHLKQVLPTATLDALRPWFKAATGVLNAQAIGVGGWMDKVRILPQGHQFISPVVNADVQAAVYQGVFENRRLDVTYKPRNASAAKSYEINPIALVQRGYLVYIICTIREYNDIKQLLIHRIQSATVLDKPALWPQEFDLDRYIEEGELGYRLGPPIKLIADFAPGAAANLHEAPISMDQTLKARRDGKTRLTATVQDTWELRAWLRGFGNAIEAIEPSNYLDN